MAAQPPEPEENEGMEVESDTTTSRGAGIARRLAELGVSDRMFHERTGIDRKTLKRAIADEQRVRSSTYRAIENAITELEMELDARHGGGGGPSERTISFALQSGELSVTVEGPITDAGALREQVEALVHELRRGTT